MKREKERWIWGKIYAENYCESRNTTGYKNISECLRFKCWQRQEIQEIISAAEGQEAMPEYLQSSLCVTLLCLFSHE